MPANVESMFYVGDMPWHREGTRLKNPPNTMTAIKRAGLNWEVEKTELYTAENSLIDNFFGIQRLDNNKILGIVKKEYQPLQNSEAFNFFDPLINSKFISYETAGSLGDGEIIWILAKIEQNDTFKVHNKDEIIKYLLLSNSHDGQSAVSIKFTPIRVVCQNTLNIALKEGDAIKIIHQAGMYSKLEETQLAMNNILNIFNGIEGTFNSMAKCKMPIDDAKKYFNSLYPIIYEKYITTESQYIKRLVNISAQEQLCANFETGYGIREYGLEETLWAAYNAVTQYIDHPLNYKLGDNKLVKRIWFGEGELIKKKAYRAAVGWLRAA